MRKSFLMAAASAIVLAASGTSVLAQSSSAGAPQTLGGPYYNSSTPAYQGRFLAIEAPANYIGRTIVNAQGQVVGKITEIRGNDIIVTADPWVGVGQRVVLWPRDRMVFTSTGNTVVISTPMTREEIAVLPVYQMSPQAMQMQGPPPPNGMGGLIPAQPYLGPLPQSLVGKNIYGLRNDLAGTITGIQDDRMLVSVGGYLGMGERIVVFPREWATFTGSGDNLTVGTLANKEQISHLPVYAGVVNEAPTQTKK